MLTQTRLKQVLKYDPLTGVFTWLIRRGNRKAGDIAGSINSHGYRVIAIDGVDYRAHHLAYLYQLGRIPHCKIDHKDGNRSCNIWSNLREASPSQNNFNQKLRSDNTSGVKGVSFDHRRKKWEARVTVSRKSHRVGFFTNLNDAEKAIKMKRIQLHGEFTNHG